MSYQRSLSPTKHQADKEADDVLQRIPAGLRSQIQHFRTSALSSKECGDATAECKALQELGNLYMLPEVGALRPALRCFGRILDLSCRRPTFLSVEALAHMQIGECHVRLQDYSSASVHFEDAQKLFNRLKDTRQASKAYLRLAETEKELAIQEDVRTSSFSLSSLKDLYPKAIGAAPPPHPPCSEAGTRFRRALEAANYSLLIYRQLRDEPSESIVCALLAWLHERLGSVAEAVEFYKRRALIVERHAEVLRKSGSLSDSSSSFDFLFSGSAPNPSDLAPSAKLRIASEALTEAYAGLSRCLHRLGETTEELRSLELQAEWASRAASVATRHALLAALVNIGVAHLAKASTNVHEVTEAITYLSSALQKVIDSSDVEDQRIEMACYCSLGAASRLIGESATGLNYLKGALQMARELKDKHAECQSLSFIGLCFQDRNETGNAIFNHENALEIAKELQDPIEQAAAHHNLGVCNEIAGHAEEAARHLEQYIKLSSARLAPILRLDGPAEAEESKERQGSFLRTAIPISHHASTPSSSSSSSSGAPQAPPITAHEAWTLYEGVEAARDSLLRCYIRLGRHDKAASVLKLKLERARGLTPVPSLPHLSSSSSSSFSAAAKKSPTKYSMPVSTLHYDFEESISLAMLLVRSLLHERDYAAADSVASTCLTDLDNVLLDSSSPLRSIALANEMRVLTLYCVPLLAQKKVAQMVDIQTRMQRLEMKGSSRLLASLSSLSLSSSSSASIPGAPLKPPQLLSECMVCEDRCECWSGFL